MAETPFPTSTRGFGALLRAYRLAAGLTQEELAERAGLSLRGVSDLERGARQSPRLETVRMLADALGFGPGTTQRAELLAARNDPDTAPVAPERPRLPVPSTPLIGRDHEVTSVIETLDRAQGRLLTLLGPGGIGKTRLALAVADRLADHFPDGVAFVDLTPVRDPALVLPTIASALDVRESGTRPLAEEIVATIADRHLLMVLDNVEQVVDAAPRVADLLHACPNLTVLATSRVALRLTAEHPVSLDPLELPPTDDATPLADLARSPAVALFVTRAHAVDPEFALTEANAGAVATLVRRLEGLPLAIELAAARIRALPPAALLDRLDRQLPMLTGGARDAPARQRTMRDTIAWSYDLLDAGEQAVFRHLAAFVGGFTLDAAEAVAGEQAGMDIVDELSGIMDASLLRRDARSGSAPSPRFRMLETVREFGLEQLAAHGEEERARDAHAAYFQAFASSCRADMHETAPDEVRRAVHARIEAERDNLRAALAWLATRQRIDEALGLAIAIWPFPTNHTHDVEARSTIESLLAQPAATTGSSNRAHALLTLCHFARRQGNIEESVQAGREALAIFREIGDTANISRALVGLAWTFMDMSRFDEAIDHYRSALQLAEMIGDDDGTAGAHDLLGWLHLNRDELEDAEAHLLETLRISQRTGNRLRLAKTLSRLAVLATRQEDFALSARRYDEAIAIVRQTGDFHQLVSALLLYADLVYRDGNITPAESIVREAHDISHVTGYTHGIAGTLFAMGRFATDRGQLAEALSFLQQSTVAYGRIGLRYGMQYCAVLTFDALACLAYEGGDISSSVRFLGMGDALLARNNLPRPAGGLHFFERHEIDRIRARLADPELAAEWHDAHELGEREMVEETLAYAPEFPSADRANSACRVIEDG